MSNGISAIKGFDYQATVILSRLFEHFDQHGTTAQVRPEGIDDLDLYWTADSAEHRRYEQIKKPREDSDGKLKPSPWSLTDVINELLPNTIDHLAGKSGEQIWIVGDAVDDAVRTLVDAGENAPTVAAEPYWKAVHALARNDAVNAGDLGGGIRGKLLRRKAPANLPSEPADALARVVTEFAAFAKSAGAGDDLAARYGKKAAVLHSCLPGILARTRIESTFGSEQEVVKRIHDRLERHYCLPRSVIERTLFRNLRGFINDISKEPDRRFDQEEFDIELRCVWPQMIPIKEPPPLDQKHVRRRDLAEHLTIGWTGKAIEIVGISGSGKTALAAEVFEQSRTADPSRKVFYAEARPDSRLRDVLAGVAFHLRRNRISGPFTIAIDSVLAVEEVLARLARSFSTIPQAVLLLVDLVEGTCSEAFARDLATFIRALSSSECRIAVFGQESALRELSQIERDKQGVSHLDVRGFRFEEFVTLVTHYHSNPDRGMLLDVYNRVTAGRAAGLFARLAQALAAAGTQQEMSEIAAKPADDMLPYAERKRFAGLTGGSRGAAEKLVCFALPFMPKDAEEIFPENKIGSAVRELLAHGLLSHYDEDSFEMHETVRAGLEGAIALSVRRSAHEALAVWYGKQGLVTAEILHLDKAGKHNQAFERAREVFLRGERWAELAAYVTGHKLVSSHEVICAIASPGRIDNIFLLPDILRGLGDPIAVNELLLILREQPDRFYADFQWTLAIVETILEFDPKRLHDLILFSMETTCDTARVESVLAWLMIAARRKNGVIDPRSVELFKSRPPEIQRLILPFMLLDRRRDVLRHVFQFLASDQEPPERLRRSHIWPEISLQVSRLEDTVEFLAAMPSVKPAEMLIAKSALLGPLASMVWSQRKVLGAHCIEILKNAVMEEKILEGAIRVLIFLGEPSICTLCEPLLTRDDALSAFAKLVPALVPAFCDHSRYEQRVLDSGLKLEERVAALSVLASVSAGLGDIYRRLKAIEDASNNSEGWDFCFLMLCNQAPFPDAIPLLERYISIADEKGVNLIVPVLKKLGELTTLEATAMLMRALSHTNPRIRQCAALGLGERRSRYALTALVERYEKEDDEAVAGTLATAILASGARSIANIRPTSDDSPTRKLWQCILAMRLRDSTIADQLVTIAGDPTQNWQLRRAAIFAAGRLPYEAALERIVSTVMPERSPLVIDRSSNFLCHSVLSSMLLTGSQDMMQFFVSGKARFIEFLGGILEECWKGSREGLPTGIEAAGWLFDRLTYHGWPTKREAPDIVINELHIPILHSAVLRSLRLSERPDIIEEQLPHAYHVWFATKCLMERSRAGRRDPQLASRLKTLVEASPCKGESFLDRIINEVFGADAKASRTGAAAFTSHEAIAPPALYLSYADAVRVLSGASPDFKPTTPLALEVVTAQQFEHLIRLADPANDHYPATETFIPSVSFTQDGHLVSQRRVTTTNSGDLPSTLIRPAIAAANRFGLNIPWHQELLTGVFASTYVPKFLACLGAQNDSSRFYEELGGNVDELLPQICNAAQLKPILKYIDAHIVPFLLRYLSSGTDGFFEGLCTLALQVNTPEIDDVLAGLFYRWTQRFDIRSMVPQHDQNHQLWRGFNRLAEHSRFNMIEGWRPRLASVLSAQIASYRRENIVRVLERDPRSYIQIESLLFKATNWEHFHQDEIDRLDDAAERLFSQLVEE
jgi:hypothetical protein